MRTFDYNTLCKESWETDILNLVAKIHEYKGREERLALQKPATLDRLTEIARIQSTDASNKIEGIRTTTARMKQLLAAKTTPRNRDEEEILGYRNVLATIHESHDYIPIRPAHILQLHRDLLKTAGVSFAGQFKNVENIIRETRSDGTAIVRFNPVSPHETPKAVEELCQAYEQAVAYEKVDALLLIPIFILDFLCIHPFNDGNGRMSRLLTLLLLYKSGYNVGKYISIEKQIEKTKDRYYETLQQSDIGWHEGKNDPKPFIRYMLQVILACYTELEERIGLLAEQGKGSRAYDVVRQYSATKIGKFTGADVVENCPSIGRSSALAALKRLTEEEFIVREGTGRNTFYVRFDSR